jgi:hypothetical protein
MFSHPLTTKNHRDNYSSLVHFIKAADIINILQYYQDAKDNRKQPGKNEGRFKLFIPITFCSAANNTSEANTSCLNCLKLDCLQGQLAKMYQLALPRRFFHL